MSSLSITLSEDPPSSLRPDQLVLLDPATAQGVAATDTSVDYDALTRAATWTFPGLDGDALPTGQYRATLTLPGAAPYSFTFAADPANPTAVPEPGTVGLVGVAAAGLPSRRRRRAARPRPAARPQIASRPPDPWKGEGGRLRFSARLRREGTAVSGRSRRLT